MTRRELIALMPAAAIEAAAMAAPAPQPTFGIQLYTVRKALRKDPDGTLRALAEMGCKEIEAYNRVLTVNLLPKLKQYGLGVRACTVETPLITNNWEPYPELTPLPLKEAIESVAGMGAEFFCFGYIAPGARGDGEDFYRRTADRMNAAAELCRKAGLKFVWQNHAFEFAGRPGMRPIDLYKERLDVKLVGLQLDAFWLSFAGQDALKMLKEWKGHVPAVRLNDRAKGVPNQLDESIGVGAYAEAGTGVIDIAGIVKAATAAGTRFFSVGQDETEGDALESVRRSWKAVRQA